MGRAWGALAAYVGLVYGMLPFGPRVGQWVVGTRPGAWLLGSGLAVLALAGAAFLAHRLHRHRAPSRAYLTLAVALVAYGLTFPYLRAQHLERTHIPEYAIAACLAWRALAPTLPGPAGYVAAVGLAAAIGYGDELLQKIVPGRVYDLRDVAMNALGATLGVLVLAAARARGRDSDARFVTASAPPAHSP